LDTFYRAAAAENGEEDSALKAKYVLQVAMIFARPPLPHPVLGLQFLNPIHSPVEKRMLIRSLVFFPHVIDHDDSTVTLRTVT
jgi:hypothetical protein